MFRQLFIHSRAATTHIGDLFITPIHEYMQIRLQFKISTYLQKITELEAYSILQYDRSFIFYLRACLVCSSISNSRN